MFPASISEIPPLAQTEYAEVFSFVSYYTKKSEESIAWKKQMLSESPAGSTPLLNTPTIGSIHSSLKMHYRRA